MAEEGGHGGAASSTEAVPGLAVSANGLTLALDRTELPRGEPATLSFRILDAEGRAVRDFEVEQDKRMHLIVVRRDTQGFQHLHPQHGSQRALEHPGHPARGRQLPRLRRLPARRREVHARRRPRRRWPGRLAAAARRRRERPHRRAATRSSVSGAGSRAGSESELAFAVSRNGEPVRTEPYLGAGGHLVALRAGDLGYLHTHPTGRHRRRGPRSRPSSLGRPVPPVLPVQARGPGAHRRVHARRGEMSPRRVLDQLGIGAGRRVLRRCASSARSANPTLIVAPPWRWRGACRSAESAGRRRRPGR